MSSGGTRGRFRTEEATRRIRPRRVWPGSRATVGGLLIAVAALVLYSLAARSDGAPATSYVVAVVDVTPGTTLTADMLGLQAMDLPASVAATAFAPDDDALVLGGVTVTPIAAGAIVQRDLVRAPDQITAALTEVSFEIESPRALNGRLRAGERIDLVVTTGTGADAATSLLLGGVLVTEIHEGRDIDLGIDDVVVTIALERSTDAVAVVNAVDTGRITLVRATDR